MEYAIRIREQALSDDSKVYDVCLWQDAKICAEFYAVTLGDAQEMADKIATAIEQHSVDSITVTY